MKKAICGLLIFTLVIVLVSCGDSLSKIQYIGNVSVQRDDVNKGWSIFWGFYETINSNDCIKADGTLFLTITDDNGNLLFDGEGDFTKDNFGLYSSLVKKNQMLGCLWLDESNLEKSSTNTGIAKIWAALSNGIEFEPVELTIRDLPLADLNIDVINSIPLTVKTYDYRNNVVLEATISDISFNYESYSPKMRLTITLNKNYSDGDEHVYADYKIKDDEGIVISTGFVYTDKISEGDTIIAETLLHDVQRGTHYTIEFSDHNR